MNHCVCLHLLMHFSTNHSVLYIMARVRYTIEQHVCLVQLCFKFESARKCHRKFQHKFSGELVPSRQNIHYLVSNLKTTVSLLDKNPDRKRTVLTEETLDDSDARLETSPRKSLKWLAQETGVSRTSARRATKLLKLWSYKKTVVHALKEHVLVVRINFL
jgi:response regulator of citrate/malate metabolism